MQQPDKQKKSTSESIAETLRELLPYTNLGWQLVASVLLFFGAGYWGDSLFDTRPWLTVIGSVIGIVYGLTSVIRSANQLHKRKSKETT
ncbi:MAG: AtpZ/AtpI family protein [Bacteroidetes bacterium]|nr:AtpZ/AtpI family protein [Bacteroidota bacterium]